MFSIVNLFYATMIRIYVREDKNIIKKPCQTKTTFNEVKIVTITPPI